MPSFNPKKYVKGLEADGIFVELVKMKGVWYLLGEEERANGKERCMHSVRLDQITQNDIDYKLKDLEIK